MKDKATLTFIVMLSVFTTMLLANLVLSIGPEKQAYIELGQLRKQQAELSLSSDEVRAQKAAYIQEADLKLKANSNAWHSLAKEIEAIEAELF